MDVTERGALNFREFAMGMYLIQAIQSRLITSVPSTVPSELRDLFSGPALFDLHPTPKRPLHSLRSSSSPHSSSPSQSQILPMPPTPEYVPPAADDSWDVSPIERFEANKHFQKLDYNRNGYIEGKQAANFMLNYNLSSEDLARIWYVLVDKHIGLLLAIDPLPLLRSLVDLNGDNCLTKDEFTVAMHLINRKVAGDEIPTSLPPSLVPPSMRSKGTHSLSPPSPLSPKQLAKFKSPPPPPPKHVTSSRTKRAHSLLATDSTIPDCILRLTPPTSSLPPNPVKSLKSKVQSSFPTPPVSPSNHPEADFTSPFEDPVNGTSPSGRHSPLPSTSLPSNHSNNEALEEFKKETSRLTLQVDSLLSQLTVQNNLQDANESLKRERDSLEAKVLEMERTVSEVLSAHDQNGSKEQEIYELSTELASKEEEHESTRRMLAVLTEEDADLRRQLRESQAATAKAKTEIEDLRQNVASCEGNITDLRARLSDMGKEIAKGPESKSSNRELRVLLRDVTRENDSLKGQVRDMQTSMEQLLLSTKSHAKFDEVERENRRLQAHVQELEMLATQLQSSHHPNNAAQRHHHQALDEAARENEQLKNKLQTGHRAFAEFRTNSETTIDELQRKIATMEHENNQLKMEVASSSERGQVDNSVPPPAYNDSFSISP